MQDGCKQPEVSHAQVLTVEHCSVEQQQGCRALNTSVVNGFFAFTRTLFLLVCLFGTFNLIPQSFTSVLRLLQGIGILSMCSLMRADSMEGVA